MKCFVSEKITIRYNNISTCSIICYIISSYYITYFCIVILLYIYFIEFIYVVTCGAQICTCIRVVNLNCHIPVHLKNTRPNIRCHKHTYTQLGMFVKPPWVFGIHPRCIWSWRRPRVVGLSPHTALISVWYFPCYPCVFHFPFHDKIMPKSVTDSLFDIFWELDAARLTPGKIEYYYCSLYLLYGTSTVNS